MNEAKLIRMGEQIATFFDSQPGPDKAARVAAHLADFWDPTMRATLRRAVADGARVSPLLAEAVGGMQG